MVTAHGLAASIRAAQESETFDLGGMSADSIESTMETAFETPFLLSTTSMIRLTFVTGAGKQARQKYDDSANKAVTTVLQKHGYVEDRGAGCDFSSAGTYKLQHDTGKNLKTVVVFPKVAAGTNTSDSGEDKVIGSLLPENSPGYKIALCSMNVFQNMINSNCPSWLQKKGCLTCIEGLKELLQVMEAQLIKGTPLNESEQKFYSDVVQLDDKESLVRQLAHDQVEQGPITAYEKEQLLLQNTERIAALTKEGKPTAKALERKNMLESIETVAPHKLKHHAKIGKLFKEVAPLLQIETKGGRLLSIKESALVTRKEEILQEIERLEDASRGWFEDDDAFTLRVAACRNEYQTKFSPAAKKMTKQVAGTSAGAAAARRGGGNAVNKWVTPGEGRSGYAAKSMKKKSKLVKSDLFGAMMAESSSEEEETESVPATAKPKSDEIAEPGASVAVTTNTTTTTMKKAKKKKKGKKPTTLSDDDLLAATVRENEACKEKEDEAEQTALLRVVIFFQTCIVPLLVAFLGWIVGLLFGKGKKQKRKQG